METSDSPWHDYLLGETNEEIYIDTVAENRELALSMATQARRTLDIVTRSLDPRIYDTIDFVEAVKSLAVRSGSSRIRILVLEPDALVKRGHRLLELAHRLTTYVHLRIPGASHKHFNEALLIADGRGVIQRQHSDRYEGVANYYDPGVSGELLRRFDEMWEAGEPDPNLRRMSL